MIKPLDKLRFLFRSRAQVLELAKTLSLVSILTVLIWIYAERAQSDKITLQIGFDVYVNNQAQFATLIEPVATPVTAEIEGPRSKLDQLRNQLDRRIRLILPGTIQSNTEANLQTVPLLNDYPAIRGLGVTVTSASPGSIKVRVDPKKTISVPLVLPEDLQVAVTNVVFNPASVDVTGPAPEIDQLFPTRQTGIPVDLSGMMDQLNATGSIQLDAVPIAVPRVAGIEVKPARATWVKIEVSARETDFTLRTVPLVIQQPLPTVNRWEITTKEKTLTNIQLRGPASEIAKLQSVDNKPPEITPVAVLRLTGDDRTASDQQRQVAIENLPPGVSPVGPLPVVEFSVREIGTPE